MANFGLHTQNGVYNAPDDRFGLGAFAQRDAAGKVIPGIIQSPSTDALVAAASTPNLTVTVRPFVAITTDSGIGAYVGGIDTVTVMPALTPELANNRYDILAWRHLEGITTNSNGETTLGSVTLAGQTTPIAKQVQSGEVYWIKGTPSSSSTPSVPGVPAGSVPLARVYVAGGTTAISQSNILHIAHYVGSNGGLVWDPAATPGATTLPAGTLVLSNTGILMSNGSTLTVMTGAQREWWGTNNIDNVTLNFTSSTSTTSPTLLTIPLPAGVGLNVRGLARVTQPNLTGIGVAITQVEVSINSGAWTNVTVQRNAAVLPTYALSVDTWAEGFVEPAPADRSIRVRAVTSNAGRDAQNTTVRCDVFYADAQLATRV